MKTHAAVSIKYRELLKDHAFLFLPGRTTHYPVEHSGKA